MRVQWKMVLLVALVLTGTLTVVTWKARELVQKDKQSFMADAAMKQMAPLKRLVAERLEDRRSHLVNFASARLNDSLSAAKTAKRMPAEFDVISLVRPSAGAEWLPLWSEKNPASQAFSWPAGYDLLLLKSLPFTQLRDGETLWKRLSDQNGSPVYAIMLLVEVKNGAAIQSPSAAEFPETTDYEADGRAKVRAALVGFTSTPPFADIAEDYIGSTTTIYVVDDKGYVASHVNKAFLGALFSEDPIVAEILTHRKVAASGRFEDIESRSVLGHFERIDDTNLYAIATMPLAATQSFLTTLMLTILISGLSFGVLGLILAWFLGRNLETESSLVSTSEPEDAAAPEKSEVASTVPVEVFEKRSLLDERLLEGFVNAAKEPLLAILGHAQLIKVKASNDDGIRNHAESIERESRRAKEIFDRLREWEEMESVSDDNTAEEDLDLSELLKSALKEHEGLMQSEGVELRLDLHEIPRLRGSAKNSAKKIKEMFSHLIENAIEAMRARNPKKIEIQLDFIDGSNYFVMRDSGVGMSRDIAEKAFDPFFKAYLSPKRMGLGLFFVRGVVSSLNGECSLESTPGDGTTVRISLPVREADLATFRREQEEILLSSVSENMTPMPEILEEPYSASDSGVVKADDMDVLSNTDAVGDTDGADDLDDLDDADDDVFASVAIGGIDAPQIMTDGAAEQTIDDLLSETTTVGASEFQVKIRGPKARSEV